MNEIVKLTRELNDTKIQRQEELDDWERMHKNAILEKDLQIAELKEELRRIKSGQLIRNHGHSSSTGVLKGLIFQWEQAVFFSLSFSPSFASKSERYVWQPADAFFVFSY